MRKQGDCLQFTSSTLFSKLENIDKLGYEKSCITYKKFPSKAICKTKTALNSHVILSLSTRRLPLKFISSYFVSQVLIKFMLRKPIYTHWTEKIDWLLYIKRRKRGILLVRRHLYGRRLQNGEQSQLRRLELRK